MKTNRICLFHDNFYDFDVKVTVKMSYFSHLIQKLVS